MLVVVICHDGTSPRHSLGRIQTPDFQRFEKISLSVDGHAKHGASVLSKQTQRLGKHAGVEGEHIRVGAGRARSARRTGRSENKRKKKGKKKKKKKKKQGKVPEWLQDGVGVSGDNDGNDSGYADDAKHCRNRQNQFEFKAAACL